MREGKILLLATNNITLERNICYSGKNANEARHTNHTLRRMDAEEGNKGLWTYTLLEQDAEGNISRWVKR